MCFPPLLAPVFLSGNKNIYMVLRHCSAFSMSNEAGNLLTGRASESILDWCLWAVSHRLYWTQISSNVTQEGNINININVSNKYKKYVVCLNKAWICKSQLTIQYKYKNKNKNKNWCQFIQLKFSPSCFIILPKVSPLTLCDANKAIRVFLCVSSLTKVLQGPSANYTPLLGLSTLQITAYPKYLYPPPRFY